MYWSFLKRTFFRPFPKKYFSFLLNADPRPGLSSPERGPLFPLKKLFYFFLIRDVKNVRFAISQYIAPRKDMSLSETEVLLMQNAMRVLVLPLEDKKPDGDLIDTLNAISVVSGRLAKILRDRKNKVEGDKHNEQERYLTAAR